jgi:hypothetical protein
MTEYEQKLYDVIVDWWDEVFVVNPPPVDRDGEYMDKNPTIIDLVKSISEINALKEWTEDAQKYYD